MFDVMQYVTIDTDRTETEKALAVEVAKQKGLTDVGITAMIGGDVEKAMTDAQAAAEAAAGTNFRTWYDIDPDLMYPAVIQYLGDSQQELIELNKQSEAQLVTLALDGNKAAHFVLKARQTISLLHQVGIEDWYLAICPRSDFEDGTGAANASAQRRGIALEVARLFFTEALHQATKGPIGVHILKAEHWRL